MIGVVEHQHRSWCLTVLVGHEALDDRIGGGMALIDAEFPVAQHRSDIGSAGQNDAAKRAVMMNGI